MKGPSGRVRYDLRRHWQCPVCHARRHTSGQVVNLRCPRCAAHDPPRQTWMHLIEEPRKPRRPARVAEQKQDAEKVPETGTSVIQPD